MMGWGGDEGGGVCEWRGGKKSVETETCVITDEEHGVNRESKIKN